MGRVSHIDRPRKTLHGRPFEAVPGKVEDTNRHTDVDKASAGQGVRLHAVLPGARKQHQRLAGQEAGQHRGGQLVDVVANAGALPERRAVIEQDAHARGIVTWRPGSG